MAFNRLVWKLAQPMPAPDPMGMGAAMPGMDAGMTPPADPMAAPDPMSDPTGAPEGQAPQKFTLGTLTNYIESNPDAAMDFFKGTLPNAQVSFVNPQGQQQSTELWSLLEPENWRHSDDETKGKVAGLIMENLPEDMKAEQTMGTEDDNVVPAVKQHADIKSSIDSSNLAIKSLALKLASSKLPRKPFNKLAQSMQPIQTNLMYGPDSVTVDPHYGYDINRWHIIERNKGWGQLPNSFFSQMGIDYDTFWRTHVMDKFYSEYQDKDGRWVGGYLNKRFETDRNVSDFNSMTLKPGERSRPSRAKLTEGQMVDARNAGKKFNFIEAKSNGLTKTALQPSSHMLYERLSNLENPLEGKQKLSKLTDAQLQQELSGMQSNLKGTVPYSDDADHLKMWINWASSEIATRKQSGKWGSASVATPPSAQATSAPIQTPPRTPQAPRLASKSCKQCGSAIMKGIDGKLCPACCKANTDEDVREAALQKKK